MSYANSLDSEDKFVSRNPWALVTLAFCLVLILALRLFYIQVMNYSHFLSKSNEIRIKKEVIEAPRGFIYDRNGEVLAENQMSYSITIDPFENDSLDQSIPRLASLVPDVPRMLDVPPDQLLETVKKKIRGSSNPIKIIRDADFRLLSIVEEHNLELNGISGVFDQRRHYPYGHVAAHMIGYMSELTEKEYKRLHEEGYEYGHSIGRQGIERYYEGVLKGRNGAKFVEMNYRNRKLGITEEVKPVYPVPGENIKLTLDVRLQIAAEEAFGDSVMGGLVALDPRNGEVLVMASSPWFDPNEFTHVLTGERYSELISDPKNPLFNRAIQATYAPGSTFKMVTALAALENGFTEQTRFKPCTGSYYFGRWYDCWKEGGHGSLNMVEAITQSCNVYFYQLARKIPLETWHHYGTILGMGEKTGIDLDGEVAGVLPSLEYYEKKGISYSPGMILNLVIGQGENLLTILQSAHYIGIIATEGIVATPHLVMSEYEPPYRISEITRESFEVVKRGMLGVVHEPTGTAISARISGHQIGGKTGTVQNPHGADHKWFVAFAPYENPTIAVACVAENTGDFSFSIAVKIVRKVLMEYFTYYPDIGIAYNDQGNM